MASLVKEVHLPGTGAVDAMQAVEQGPHPGVIVHRGSHFLLASVDGAIGGPSALTVTAQMNDSFATEDGRAFFACESPVRVVEVGANATAPVVRVDEGEENNVWGVAQFRDSSGAAWLLTAGYRAPHMAVRPLADFTATPTPIAMELSSGNCLYSAASSGSVVYVGCSSGPIMVLDFATASQPRLVTTLREHEGDCEAMCSTDAGLFVSGGDDAKIRLWDPSRAHALVHTWSDPRGKALKAVTSKQQLLASINASMSLVTLWSLVTHQLLQTISSPASCMTIMHNDIWLGREDGAAAVYSLLPFATEWPRREIEAASGEKASSFGFDDDSDDGNDAGDDADDDDILKQPFALPQAPVPTNVGDTDTGVFQVAGASRLADGTLPDWVVVGFSGRGESMRFFPGSRVGAAMAKVELPAGVFSLYHDVTDGANMVYGGTYGGACVAVDPVKQELVRTYPSEQSDSIRMLWRVGDYIVTGSDGTPSLLAHHVDNGTSHPVPLVQVPDSEVHSMACPPGKQRLYIGCDEGTILVVDVSGALPSQWNTVGRVKEHSWTVRGMKWSSYSKVLVSAASDGKVIVWSLENPDEPSVLHLSSDHSGWIRALAVAPGAPLAASGGSNDIRLWHLETYECLHKLDYHSQPVLSIGFHDQYMWTCDRENIVTRWDLGVVVDALPVRKRSRRSKKSGAAATGNAFVDAETTLLLSQLVDLLRADMVRVKPIVREFTTLVKATKKEVVALKATVPASQEEGDQISAAALEYALGMGVRVCSELRKAALLALWADPRVAGTRKEIAFTAANGEKGQVLVLPGVVALRAPHVLHDVSVASQAWAPASLITAVLTWLSGGDADPVLQLALSSPQTALHLVRLAETFQCPSLLTLAMQQWNKPPSQWQEDDWMLLLTYFSQGSTCDAVASSSGSKADVDADAEDSEEDGVDGIVIASLPVEVPNSLTASFPLVCDDSSDEEASASEDATTTATPSSTAKATTAPTATPTPPTASSGSLSSNALLDWVVHVVAHHFPTMSPESKARLAATSPAIMLRICEHAYTGVCAAPAATPWRDDFDAKMAHVGRAMIASPDAAAGATAAPHVSLTVHSTVDQQQRTFVGPAWVFALAGDALAELVLAAASASSSSSTAVAVDVPLPLPVVTQVIAACYTLDTSCIVSDPSTALWMSAAARVLGVGEGHWMASLVTACNEGGSTRMVALTCAADIISALASTAHERPASVSLHTQ